MIVARWLRQAKTHKYCTFFKCYQITWGLAYFLSNFYVFIRHFEFKILHRSYFNLSFEPVISLRFFASSSVTIHNVYFSFSLLGIMFYAKRLKKKKKRNVLPKNMYKRNKKTIHYNITTKKERKATLFGRIGHNILYFGQALELMVAETAFHPCVRVFILIWKIRRYP